MTDARAPIRRKGGKTGYPASGGHLSSEKTKLLRTLYLYLAISFFFHKNNNRSNNNSVYEHRSLAYCTLYGRTTSKQYCKIHRDTTSTTYRRSYYTIDHDRTPKTVFTVRSIAIRRVLLTEERTGYYTRSTSTSTPYECDRPCTVLHCIRSGDTKIRVQVLHTNALPYELFIRRDTYRDTASLSFLLVTEDRT